MRLRPNQAIAPLTSEDFDGDGAVSSTDFFILANGFGSGDPTDNCLPSERLIHMLSSSNQTFEALASKVEVLNPFLLNQFTIFMNFNFKLVQFWHSFPTTRPRNFMHDPEFRHVCALPDMNVARFKGLAFVRVEKNL